MVNDSTFSDLDYGTNSLNNSTQGTLLAAGNLVGASFNEHQWVCKEDTLWIKIPAHSAGGNITVADVNCLNAIKFDNSRSNSDPTIRLIFKPGEGDPSKIGLFSEITSIHGNRVSLVVDGIEDLQLSNVTLNNVMLKANVSGKVSVDSVLVSDHEPGSIIQMIGAAIQVHKSFDFHNAIIEATDEKGKILIHPDAIVTHTGKFSVHGKEFDVQSNIAGEMMGAGLLAETDKFSLRNGQITGRTLNITSHNSNKDVAYEFYNSTLNIFDDGVIDTGGNGSLQFENSTIAHMGEFYLYSNTITLENSVIDNKNSTDSTLSADGNIINLDNASIAGHHLTLKGAMYGTPNQNQAVDIQGSNISHTGKLAISGFQFYSGRNNFNSKAKDATTKIEAKITTIIETNIDGQVFGITFPTERNADIVRFDNFLYIAIQNSKLNIQEDLSLLGRSDPHVTNNDIFIYNSSISYARKFNLLGDTIYIHQNSKLVSETDNSILSADGNIINLDNASIAGHHLTLKGLNNKHAQEISIPDNTDISYAGNVELFAKKIETGKNSKVRGNSINAEAETFITRFSSITTTDLTITGLSGARAKLIALRSSDVDVIHFNLAAQKVFWQRDNIVKYVIQDPTSYTDYESSCHYERVSDLGEVAGDSMKTSAGISFLGGLLSIICPPVAPMVAVATIGSATISSTAGVAYAVSKYQICHTYTTSVSSIKESFDNAQTTRPTVILAETVTIDADELTIHASDAHILGLFNATNKLKVIIFHEVAEHRFKAEFEYKYYEENHGRPDTYNYEYHSSAYAKQQDIYNNLFYKGTNAFGCKGQDTLIYEYDKAKCLQISNPSSDLRLTRFEAGRSIGSIEKFIYGVNPEMLRKFAQATQQQLYLSSSHNTALVNTGGYLIVHTENAAEKTLLAKTIMSQIYVVDKEITPAEQHNSIVNEETLQTLEGIQYQPLKLLPGSAENNSSGVHTLFQNRHESITDCKKGTITLLQDLGINSAKVMLIFASPSLEAHMLKLTTLNKTGHTDAEYADEIVRITAGKRKWFELAECEHLDRLIENAKQVINQYQLVIGKPLEEKYLAALKKPFVWPIYKLIRNDKALVLELYLTRKALEHSVARQGGSLASLGYLDNVYIGEVIGAGGKLLTSGGNLVIGHMISASNEIEDVSNKGLNVTLEHPPFIFDTVKWAKKVNYIAANPLFRTVIKGTAEGKIRIISEGDFKAENIALIDAVAKIKGKLEAEGIMIENVVIDADDGIYTMPIPLYNKIITFANNEETTVETFDQILNEFKGDIIFISRDEINIQGVDAKDINAFKANATKDIEITAAVTQIITNSYKNVKGWLSEKTTRSHTTEIDPLKQQFGKEGGNGTFELYSEEGGINVVGTEVKLASANMTAKKDVTVAAAVKQTFTSSSEEKRGIFSSDSTHTSSTRIDPKKQQWGSDGNLNDTRSKLTISSKEGNVTFVGTELAYYDYDITASLGEINLLPAEKSFINEIAHSHTGIDFALRGNVFSLASTVKEITKTSEKSYEPTIVKAGGELYMYAGKGYVQLASRVEGNEVIIKSPAGYDIRSLNSEKVRVYDIDEHMYGIHGVASLAKGQLTAGAGVYDRHSTTTQYVSDVDKASIKAKTLTLEGGVLKTQGIDLEYDVGIFNVIKHIDAPIYKVDKTTSDTSFSGVGLVIGVKSPLVRSIINSLGLVKDSLNLIGDLLDDESTKIGNTVSAANVLFRAHKNRNDIINAINGPMVQAGWWIDIQNEQNSNHTRTAVPEATSILGMYTIHNAEEIDFTSTRFQGVDWQVNAKKLSLKTVYAEAETSIDGQNIDLSAGMNIAYKAPVTDIYVSNNKVTQGNKQPIPAIISLSGVFSAEVDLLVNEGGQITADDVQINAKDLIISSVKTLMKDEQYSWFLSKDIQALGKTIVSGDMGDYIGKFVDGMGARFGTGDMAWVNDMASIIGRKNVDIILSGVLDMTGAMIVNAKVDASGKLTDEGHLTIESARLIQQDIEGFNTGITTGFSAALDSTTRQARDATDASKHNTKTHDALGVDFAYRDFTQKTKSTIGQGSVETNGHEIGDDTLNRHISNMQFDKGFAIPELNAHLAKRQKITIKELKAAPARFLDETVRAFQAAGRLLTSPAKWFTKQDKLNDADLTEEDLSKTDLSDDDDTLVDADLSNDDASTIEEENLTEEELKALKKLLYKQWLIEQAEANKNQCKVVKAEHFDYLMNQDQTSVKKLTVIIQWAMKKRHIPGLDSVSEAYLFSSDKTENALYYPVIEKVIVLDGKEATTIFNVPVETNAPGGHGAGIYQLDSNSKKITNLPNEILNQLQISQKVQDIIDDIKGELKTSLNLSQLSFKQLPVEIVDYVFGIALSKEETKQDILTNREQRQKDLSGRLNRAADISKTSQEDLEKSFENLNSENLNLEEFEGPLTKETNAFAVAFTPVEKLYIYLIYGAAQGFNHAAEILNDQNHPFYKAIGNAFDNTVKTIGKGLVTTDKKMSDKFGNVYEIPKEKVIETAKFVDKFLKATSSELIYDSIIGWTIGKVVSIFYKGAKITLTKTWDTSKKTWHYIITNELDDVYTATGTGKSPTKITTPAPQTKVTTPAPQTKVTTPAPQTKVTTPTPQTKVTTPTPNRENLNPNVENNANTETAAISTEAEATPTVSKYADDPYRQTVEIKDSVRAPFREDLNVMLQSIENLEPKLKRKRIHEFMKNYEGVNWDIPMEALYKIDDNLLNHAKISAASPGIGVEFKVYNNKKVYNPKTGVHEYEVIWKIRIDRGQPGRTFSLFPDSIQQVDHVHVMHRGRHANVNGGHIWPEALEQMNKELGAAVRSGDLILIERAKQALLQNDDHFTLSQWLEWEGLKAEIRVGKY
ncbi:hypothetical protein [Rickettsia endosymbiont of Cardiosporidium cionae]|uniref:hypothetical protein n=1 Tax=Rickettsia endosymbiont of Cardiosporidium cionae TaxID=2777155 RepID=UPI0018954394|nr:hypothetical protein [Rickettsia endosymbiont of Cardiosporidium cionae]